MEVLNLFHDRKLLNELIVFRDNEAVEINHLYHSL
jgi:hypothetical protein